MHTNLAWGVMITGLSGLIMGTSPWPLKLMRHFRYEHFALVSMVFALVVLPWLLTLGLCPHPWAAIAAVPTAVLWKANLFSLAWGVAQILAVRFWVFSLVNGAVSRACRGAPSMPPSRF